MTTHRAFHDEPPGYLDQPDEPPELDDPPAPTPGRIPPHDLDVEAALLGAMLLPGTAIRAATDLHVVAGDFYKPAHAVIYRAVLNLYDADQPVDLVTVAAELRRVDLLDAAGGKAALAAIQAGTPASQNAGHYARVVREHGRTRALLALSDQLTAAIYDGDPTDGVLHQIHSAATPPVSDRYESGGAFIAGGVHGAAPVWGNDDGHVLWAEGESLLVVGPTGVGKTTLVGQVVLARLGLLEQVLGFPVAQTSSKVLYVAADRPAQIQRSFARMIAPEYNDVLDERLVFWKGPPDQDFGKHPQALLAMARARDADTVIIDSLKDVAIPLRDDEVGAGLNSAIQHCLANGVQVAALHHQRKGQQGAPPKTIEDVYGSTWITAGAGSVLLLWGSPGDPIVQMTHLKQPANPVGPFELDHDHDRGITTVARGTVNVLHLLRHTPGGVTSTDLAALNKEGGKPTKVEIRRALRQLERLERDGWAQRIEARVGGPGGTEPVRFVASTPPDREQESHDQEELDDVF